MPTLNTSVEELIEKIGYGWFQVRLLMLCAIGYFAVNAEMLLTIFVEQPLMDKFDLTTDTYAILPFAVNLVSCLTATLCGVLADRVGRKIFFIVALFIVAAFGLCSAFVHSWWMFIFFRCLVATGLGGLSVIDYVMFIECTPKKRRGTYSMILFLLGCLGVLYIAGLSLINLENALGGLVKEDWRVLTILTALPTLLTIILRCCFAEETPHYLISKGRYVEAHAVLARMAHDNKSNVELPSLEEFVRQAEESGGPVGPPSGNVLEVLKYKTWELSLPLMALWFLQSVTYWGLTMFLPTFFMSAGVRPNLIIFFMVLSELPGGVIAAVLMDSPGRVPTLRIFLAISLFFSTFTTVASVVDSKALLIAGAVGIYMFLIPVWSVIFLLTPESYPTQLRATAMGLFLNVDSVPGLVTPFLSALIADGTPWHYIGTWTIVLLVNCCVVTFWLKKPSKHGYPALESTVQSGGQCSLKEVLLNQGEDYTVLEDGGNSRFVV